MIIIPQHLWLYCAILGSVANQLTGQFYGNIGFVYDFYISGMQKSALICQELNLLDLPQTDIPFLAQVFVYDIVEVLIALDCRKALRHAYDSSLLYEVDHPDDEL